jgi:hypothetical protein
METKQRIYDGLDSAKIAFSNNQFDAAILLCGMTIERVLSLSYKKLLPEITDSTLRLRIVEAENEIGQGSITKITLGGWAQIFNRFNLLNIMEELFDINLNEAKNIDFKLLAQFRNKAAHFLDSDFKIEAGYCIFQTSSLVEGLKMIINENYSKEISLYVQNSKIDSISYLKIKIDHLKPKPTEIINKNLNDAIQISEINPEDALAKLRKSLEILLRDLCSLNGLKHSGLALNDLVVKLSEKGKIPNKVFKQMEIVKQFGNRGVHPEGEQYGIKDLELVFIAFILIVEWYLTETMPNSV